MMLREKTAQAGPVSSIQDTGSPVDLVLVRAGEGAHGMGVFGEKLTQVPVGSRGGRLLCSAQAHAGRRRAMRQLEAYTLRHPGLRLTRATWPR